LFFIKKFDIMIRFWWSFLTKIEYYFSVNGRFLLKKILFDQISSVKINSETDIHEQLNFLGYGYGTPEFFGCLGYFVGCGYPTRTRTLTRGNSVAHVWKQLRN